MQTKPYDQARYNEYLRMLRAGEPIIRQGRPPRELLAAVAAIGADPEQRADIEERLRRAEHWTPARRRAQADAARARAEEYRQRIAALRAQIDALRAGAAGRRLTDAEARLTYDMGRLVVQLAAKERRAAARVADAEAKAGPMPDIGL